MRRHFKKTFIVFVVGILLVLSGCNAPPKGDLLFLDGVDAYNEGDYVTAIEHLEQAVEIGLKRYEIGDLYTYLGHCYSDMEMYDESINYYKMALEVGPDKVEYYVNLGVTYRRSGENQKALELYLQALKLDPDYAELHSGLGSLYILENQPEKAVEYFDKAIALDSNLAVAYGNGALAYALIGDFETAEEYLEKAEVRGYENIEVLREKITTLCK